MNAVVRQALAIPQGAFEVPGGTASASSFGPGAPVPTPIPTTIPFGASDVAASALRGQILQAEQDAYDAWQKALSDQQTINISYIANPNDPGLQLALTQAIQIANQRKAAYDQARANADRVRAGAPLIVSPPPPPPVVAVPVPVTPPVTTPVTTPSQRERGGGTPPVTTPPVTAPPITTAPPVTTPPAPPVTTPPVTMPPIATPVPVTPARFTCPPFCLGETEAGPVVSRPAFPESAVVALLFAVPLTAAILLSRVRRTR
jgi:hypothetical protein